MSIDQISDIDNAPFDGILSERPAQMNSMMQSFAIDNPDMEKFMNNYNTNVSDLLDMSVISNALPKSINLSHS